MDWLWFWIILYLAVIVILTLKHVKATDLDNYLVNNRRTGTLPLVFTTLATFVGGGTSIGLMAMGYESGFAAVGIGVAYVIGFFILSRYASRIHRAGEDENIYSFPEFLIRKFSHPDDPVTRRWLAVTVTGVNIFIFFFLLSAQFVGMAALLKFAFNLGYMEAAVISCLVVIGYTAFAGLSGVIMTDMMQFIVILVMIILIFIPGTLIDTNGLKDLNELPVSFLNGSFYGWTFLVALPLFVAPSVMVRMDIWQRMLAARSDKVARRVSILSGLGMLPFYIIFPLVGMAVKVIGQDMLEPKDVAYVFLHRHSTEFILGFAVVGLLSALMSSGDSFLNIISISAVRDFLPLKGKIPPQVIQRKIRIAAIIFGVIALVMALSLPRIVDLMVVGIATIVIFVPATFLALTGKDVQRYRRSALYSIGAGFLTNLGFFVFGLANPGLFDIKTSFIPAFLVSLTILLPAFSKIFRETDPV